MSFNKGHKAKTLR